MNEVQQQAKIPWHWRRGRPRQNLLIYCESFRRGTEKKASTSTSLQFKQTSDVNSGSNPLNPS